MHGLEKIDYSNTSTKAITVGKAVNRVRKAVFTVPHPHLLGVATSS